MINLKYGFFIMRRKTNEQFLKECKEKYGEKYILDNVNYQGNKIKVSIICREHGPFEMTPLNFLQGHECPECKGKRPMSLEKFKKLASKVHNGFYNYDKTIMTKDKVLLITCPKHGDFEQNLYSHLDGHGCKKCRSEKLSKKYTCTQEEFIKKCKEKHGDSILYDKTVYNGCREEITATCPKHGDFKLIAYYLLQNTGCPTCRQSELEKIINKALINENINFTQQKTFDWLKLKEGLSLDFFLPDYNIAIECQGIQHFEPLFFFGGEESFKKQQVRDTAKKRLCDEHGIKVLYFTHYSKIQEGGDIYKDADKLLNEITKNKFIRDI